MKRTPARQNTIGLALMSILLLIAVSAFLPFGGPTVTVFGIIGDYGTDGSAELAVSNLVKSWNPEFIVTVGDNNYPDGQSATIDDTIGQYYSDFIYPYVGGYGSGAVTNNFYPALGNHDWTSSGSVQPYQDYFVLPGNERYYDFVRGPVHFFILDSDLREPDGRTSDSVQAIWLQAQLAASTAPWQLVMMHHPAYSSGANHGSHPELQWPYQAWGADAVFSGHEHQYERIDIAGLPYFVNGTSGDLTGGFDPPIPGSQVRYNAEHGAMRVEASVSQITFQFINKDGVLIDSYTLLAGGVNTPTPTATETATSTPTSTETLTVTLTPTPTPTLTLTPTSTPTATQSATASATPSASSTLTATRTPTPNTPLTPTASPTATATPTAPVVQKFYLPIVLR